MARAWCPGHVTGLFAIRDSPSDRLARGSIGAGFSTSLGVTAELRAVKTARAWSSESGVEVWRGKKQARLAQLAVTRRVLDSFSGIVPAPRRKHALSLRFMEELPPAQGFGISGAAALSLSLALSELYDLPPRLAHEIAHVAEVESRTGLGDVAGQVSGGFEARVRSGLPPSGRVLRFEIDGPVVLASLGAKLETMRVLTDPQARRKVNAAGARALRTFLTTPTKAGFAAVSQRFAQESGLMHPPVASLVARLEGIAPAGQVMLGRTLFALPEEGEVAKVLKLLPKGAPRWVTRISPRGCGVLS